MVLHPIGVCAPRDGIQPAWTAVERRQRARAEAWWLTSQPDHAALSAALAASFIAPPFPAVDRLIARAIEVHDSGWNGVEPETDVPPLDDRGKPLSFIEIAPLDFLRAWTASIERAEQVCPSGGYIVSRHFCQLGQGRLDARFDTSDDTARLESFLTREAERRRRLLPRAGRGPEELDALLAVLQFCDLLSLFLCCGATEAVEFPQEFGGRRVRVFPRDGGYVLEPSPFQAPGRTDVPQGLSLGVRMRRYPLAPAGPNTTTMAFLLW